MTVDLTILDASIQQMEATGRQDKADQLKQLKEKIRKTQEKLDSSLHGLKSNRTFKTPCCRRKKKKENE